MHQPERSSSLYDPGLGSRRSKPGFLFTRSVRWIYDKVSQATGLGITQNVIDCYAAIIRLAKPEDRIFLFGFSRGAYTIRSVAAVVALCGVPTRNRDGNKLPLDESGSKNLATYAVKHIYQFTPSRKKEKATPRQKFLLETRKKLAKRFRAECASSNPANAERANVYPYFVSAFDTVAALGSLSQSVGASAVYAGMAALVSFVLSYALQLPLIGGYLGFLNFWPIYIVLLAVAITIALCIYIGTHTKFDFHVPGYSAWQQVQTFHFTVEWKHTFYDTDLNINIPYAKHAISIDENRRDFARVRWGVPDERPDRDEYNNLTFEQVWFPGNPTDVGGGYKENESRLSDAALKWILACAYIIPNGIRYDKSVLRLYPDSGGMQHDEVKSGFGAIPNFFGRTWTYGARELPKMDNKGVSDATMHRSVYERFDIDEVPQYDVMQEYRPGTLAIHVDFKDAYANPKGKSNPDRSAVAQYIEDRLP